MSECRVDHAVEIAPEKMPAGGAPPTFANPIAPGADPWVIRHDGFYYWCASEDGRSVTVYRSTRLTELGERVVVWRAPAAGPHCAEVWAPELHRLDGRWYIYVAASNGRNETHRMIVLESVGAEPTSEFRFKAELYTGDDQATGENNRWAIDGTVLERGGRRYLLWSGWEDGRDVQWLYIAALSNPWTVSSNRVRLCANDTHLWERVDECAEGRGLNEAPQVLVRGDRVFVIYSASGSWQTSYKLGLLELDAGGDPMAPPDWRKHHEPVFAPTAATWGIGHCSFTTSPDGTEDWIAYHAKVERSSNWNRVVHLQRFSWGADGRPVFGAPVAAGAELERPSGEAERPLERATSAVAFGRAALLAAIGDRPMIEQVRVTHA